MDLYLVHWPGAGGVDVASAENGRLRAETWAALEDLHKEGVLKAIGVSNFEQRHLHELLSNLLTIHRNGHRLS